VTRDGRRPSPEAPWECEVRRVEMDRPTEAARPVLWPPPAGEPCWMGIGADPVPGIAIGLDMTKWGWVGQVIESGGDRVFRGSFESSKTAICEG
jgi:hypothetical protein